MANGANEICLIRGLRMPDGSSSSGPLVRLGIVLIALTVAGCVQRRADGRRGSDADSTVSATAKNATAKVDTGVVAPPQHPVNTVDSTAIVRPPQPGTTSAPVTAAPSVPPDTLRSADTAPSVTGADLVMLEQRRPIVPISGIPAAKLPDTFNELRGGTRKHEALDILAPRGTPVHSADDGTVIKLFTSKAGGLTAYVTGPAQRFMYYYAHLDAYAKGLTEGQTVRKGDILGYVGTTGDADPNVPHLHFAIARIGNIKEWWKGEPIDPTTVLQAAARDRAQ